MKPIIALTLKTTFNLLIFLGSLYIQKSFLVANKYDYIISNLTLTGL